MHTIKILVLGFVLLGAFLLIGRTLGNGARAALYFLPAWLAGAVINLWYGVAKAGYSVRDEAPIFLLSLRCSGRRGPSRMVEVSLAVKLDKTMLQRLA